MGNTVQEALEARKKRLGGKTSTNSSSNSSYFKSSYDEVNAALENRQKRIEEDKDNILADLQKRYNSVIEGYTSAIDSYKPSFGENAFADTLGKHRQSTVDVSTLKRDIQAYGRFIGDDKTVNELLSNLDKVSGGYRNIFDNAKYASQFDSQETYDWHTEYSGYSYSELKDKLNIMDKSTDEYKWLSSFAPSVMKADDYKNEISAIDDEISALENVLAQYEEMSDRAKKVGYSDYSESWMRDFGKKYGSTKDIEDKIEELKGTKWQYENALKYNDLSEKEDFAEISAKVADDITNKFTFQIGDKIIGWGDPRYDYINDIDGTRQNTLLMHEGKDPYYAYSFMEKEEIATYNYLYNVEGKDSANEYLEYLKYDLDARKNGQIATDFAKYTTEHPVIMNALSVPATLLGGTGTIDVTLQNLSKNIEEAITGEYSGPINYNSGGMTPTIISSTIRGTTAQNIVNATGVIELDEEEHPILSEILNGKSLADVYQLGMSMVDSTATALLSLYLGATAATSLLAGNAASQGILDAVSNGATDEQALTMGILNGAFEFIFEKYELEHLLGADTNMLKAVINQSFTEAFGEGFTSLANIVADTIVMAEKSDLNAAINEYMADGLSREEATKAALLDAAIQVGWDFVGGFASGGVMGSAFSAANNIVINNERAVEQYGNAQTELVAEGLESAEGSRSNKLAQRYQNRLDKGKELTGGQINRLVKANEKQFIAEDMNSIAEAAVSRLSELGETGDINAIGAALAKQAAGQKLTRAEKQIISNSKYGQRVANELNTDNINAETHSSAWAEKIDTNRINPDEYSRLVEEAQITQESAETSEGTTTTPIHNEPQEAEIKPDTTPVAAIPETDNVSVPEESEQMEQAAEVSDNENVITIEEASKKYGAQAKAMIHTYHDDQDVAKYDAAYEQAYNMGNSGVSLSYAMNSESTAYLTEAQRELAYNAGKAASDTAASEKEAANKKLANGKTGRKRGVVRGEGVTISDLKKTFNDRQNTAYKLLSTYAEATGVDIVLYRSETNAEGRYEGAQGKYKQSEPGTIYIDINAGLSKIKDVNDLAKYTMLRTFAHEFTHFIENWNPVQYNVFRKVVFETLTERGENVQDLIEAKQAANPGMSYDKASREVVAEAMTDILPDANFVEKLANNHKTIFDKLLEKLKEFVNTLREYFNSIGHNRSREANALKEQVGDAVRYVESIVKMFDTVAVQAVENYQLTIAVDEVTGETTVVETKVETEVTETAEPIVEEIETVPEAAAEIPFDKRTISLFKSALRVGIMEFEGQKYITDGSLVLPIASEAAEKYAYTEFNALRTDFPEATKKLLAGANTLITKAPTEGKGGRETIYIFDADGKKMYFSKKLMSYIDGGLLYYGDFAKGGYVIKSVGEDGNVKGYLLSMRMGKESSITDTKPSKLKSFSKKMQALINAQTAPIETMAETAVPAKEELPPAKVAEDQYDEISDALQNTNVFRKGEYEFSVSFVPGAGYNGKIKRNPDKYVSNAIDVVFSSMFATRPEAVADIAGIARNNRLLEAVTPAPTVKEKTASAKVNDTGSETASEKLAAKLLEGYINSENINRGGKELSSKDLYALADEAFGGTQAEGAYNRKDAYDAMELAVNKFLLGEAARAYKTFNGTAKSAVSTVEFMQDMLDLLPTQNVRTQEMEDFQQFSTPPNIAYLAAWVANITNKDFVLEPSAGIGGLAVFAKAWGAEVAVNELSKRRLEVLRAMGFDHLFNENAEQIDNILPDSISPSVVIMNPPFSSTAGRTTRNKTSNAEKHIDQALARLRDGGRLVAVLGKGMNDTDYYSYWDKLRKSFNIRANLSIDGNNYKKYGTTWGVQIVVIDKTGPQTGKTVTGKFTDLTEVPNVLEVIRNDRSTEIKSAPVVTSSESAPVTKGTVTGQDTVSDTVSVENNRPAGDKGSRNRADTGRTVDTSQSGIREQPAGVQNVDRAGGRDVSRPGVLTEGTNETAETGVNAAAEEQTGTVISNDDTVVGNDNGELTAERNEPGAESARSGEIEQSDDGVYATFVAPDVPVKGGKKHPAVLVESAAMAAVSMPKATYKVKLPANVIKNNLSDAQLVTVTYAGQAHEQKLPDGRRKGFFVGDGTGVGKGRQIAGIILDNFMQGRTKAVWISKNNDLYGDAIRDWTATTGRSKDEVVSHNKVKPKDKISIKEGILYSTYDTLKSEKGGSRLEQIVEWLGEDFDGVIAFDEAHNMGNLFGKKGKFGKSKGSEKARAGVELQRRLPNARIVYVSATAATEVDNLAYAERIGLWGAGTAFASAQDFIAKIGSSGLAAMELVIRDMKAMGTYVARSISYNGVNYDTVEHVLDPMQTEIYNTMSRAWQKTMSNVQTALETTGGKYNSTERQRALGNFYSGMQRFYNQVLTSMAMPSVIADMRRELDAGHSAVLQIVNTNEAQQNKQLAEAKANGESLDNLDLTPREALIGYLMNSFPTQMFEEYTDDDGNLRSRPVMDSAGNPVQNKEAIRQRDALVAEVNQMSIPDGPLEMLFDAFGPDAVAENTGRSRRVVPKKMADGSITRVEERRTLNHRTADVQAFQDGKKRILVFSDAGGTGKSYHADRTEKNQQLRIHYVLQPGWVASNAVQGFGRTHRSNEASAPIYKLVTTNIKGQKRFTSTIARRLDQLGALTKGQRDTGSGMFGAKDNLETDLAKDSLREFYRRLGKNLIEGIDGMKTLDRLGLKEKFTDEFGAFKINDNLARDISTFLNRILALEVDEQNVVFDAFISIYEMELEAAIQSGTLDTGMENVKADKIEVVDDKVIRQEKNTGSETHYIQAKTYTKPKVVTTIAEISKKRDGFVGVYRTENGAVRAVFRIADKTTEWGAVQKQFRLVGPNQGARTNVWNENTLEAKAEAIDKGEWQKEWDAEVARVPEYNEDTLHMLTGALLPIWNSLPQEGNTKVKRLIAHDGKAYLGRVIDKEQIDSVLHNFSIDRTKEVFTAQQVMDKAIDNGVHFYLTNNRTEIFRSRVSGQWRLEIVQPYNAWFLTRTYPDLIQERIQYRDRYFIPVGEKGIPVLEKILKDNPVRNTTDDSEQYQSRAYLGEERYSYEKFVNKPDMVVPDLDSQIPTTRADVISQAKKNAASIGNTHKDGSVSVYVNDIGADVILSKKGLAHGLDRRFKEIAPVTLKAGEIIGNSIKINELTPSKEEADASYVLIGAAKNSTGDLYIVRSIVNKFSSELTTMDVLYAINAKKSTAVLNAPLVSTPDYRTTISIADLLDYVNRYFPDVLPESVLKHFGHDARPEGTIGEDALYQQRTSTLTNREILSMAADNLNIGELTAGEQDALNIFKKHLARLEELQEQRVEQGRLYKEQQFGEKVDREAAKETLNRMHILDDQIKAENDDLFTIEEKAVLRKVLEKARKVIEQTEREHGKEILKRWRDRRNNAAAIKKYRERLRTDVDELSNWVLHPNNKDVVKHIPDALKSSVIPFLSSINFMSKQSLKGGKATVADKEFIKRLNDLKATLKPHLNVDDMYNAYTDLPPNFMDRLDTFITSAQALVDNNSGEFIINQMTAEELKELSQVVRTLKEYIKNFNKFHVNAMFQHVYEAGDDTILTLGSMKEAGPRTGNISNFVLWQQMRPAYAFERFGDGGKAIYDGLRRGQSALAFNTKKIQEFAEKAYTAAEVKAWEKEIKEIRVGGDIIKMPVSTIMSFYELSKRPQALGHMLGEGIRVATFKANGKKISDVGHTLTSNDVKRIIDTLTPRQKEVADTLQKFMQEQGGKWGNYVSVKRFGEELFGEEHYFPINSDGRHLSVNAEEHPAAASLYALLNMGFTKSTQEGAKNRIVLYSIFDVFANHMASMAQYNAFALPVVDAIKWFNYQQKSEPDENGSRAVLSSVRDQMDRVYGVPEETRPGSGRQGYAQTFVINILKAFNGTEAQGVPTDTTGLNALRQYNMAQVAYNLRVVMQQPLAITRAALILDYGSILKGMKLDPKAIQRNIEEMQKYSGIAAWKSLGFYDINISRGLTEIIKHRSTVLDKVNDVGMWGAEKADLMTWAAMWSAAKQEVIKKQKLTPKSEGFYEAVTELFEEVIYKTQVVDSVLTKNEYLRSKGAVARYLGSFMSEPTTTASMLVDAYDKYHADIQRGFTKQEAWKRNKNKIIRTAYVYAISAVMLAAVQAVADAWRDDDDYENFLEKWLEAFKGNVIDELVPVNKLPILSDAYELLKELLSVFGVDTYGNAPQSVIMQWWDVLVDGIKILHDRRNRVDTNYTWYGGVYKLLQAIAGITGLPMATTTRELVTAWNNTVGSMAPSLKVKTYDAGDQSEIKHAYQDGYLTAEEATKELIEKGIADTENEAYFIIAEWEDPDGSYSRYDKLYDAVRNGGDFDAAMDELVSHGYTEKDVLSQLKSEIGTWYKEGKITKQQATSMLTKYFDMDSEEITATVNKWSSKVVTGIEFDDIKTKYLDGEITASRAAEMYVRYGGYTKAEAQQKVSEWDFEEKHGYAYSNRGEQFKEGNISAAELVNIMVSFDGKTMEEAQSSLASYTKSGYKEGAFTRSEAINIMVQHGGLTADEAEAKVQHVDFKREYPGYELTEVQVSTYYNELAYTGLGVPEYAQYVEERKGIKGVDADGDGKIDAGSVKSQVMTVIDSLPITTEQKDALYYLNGWAASRIYEAPWH